MKYLVTGKNGQLAREFLSRFESSGADFVAPDESLLDITRREAVLDAISAYRPGVIINCAAYNLVDKAEQDRGAAFAVNAEGPRNLAEAAAANKAVLVHFGSDYVFDGTKENGLYVEDDAVNPLNEYGRSKLEGERNALAGADAALVFRLSWVFGPGKQNFLYKLTGWARTNEFLKIACDEFSVPTFTGLVVDATLKALEQGVTGMFHLTNSGYCSRYEWAKAALRAMGIEKFVRPVPMGSFNLPAQRPKFSAMSNARICSLLGVTLPSWEEAVTTFLQKGGLTGA